MWCVDNVSCAYKDGDSSWLSSVTGSCVVLTSAGLYAVSWDRGVSSRFLTDWSPVIPLRLRRPATALSSQSLWRCCHPGRQQVRPRAWTTRHWRRSVVYLIVVYRYHYFSYWPDYIYITYIEASACVLSSRYAMLCYIQYTSTQALLRLCFHAIITSHSNFRALW